jgi:hypothetical protein
MNILILVEESSEDVGFDKNLKQWLKVSSQNGKKYRFLVLLQSHPSVILDRNLFLLVGWYPHND